MHKTQIEIRGVFWAVALVFSVFLVLPMALLLGKSFLVGGESGLGNYTAMLASPAFLESFRNSFLISGISAALTTALAFFLAYAVNNTGLPPLFRKFIAGMTVAPMFLPTITYGFVIIYSFGREGLLTRLLGFQVLDIYGFQGMLLGYTIYTLPVAFLLINNTFKYVDKNFVIVSKVMGDGPVRTFLGTAVRPLVGTLGAALIQSFTLSFTDFGIPASIGGSFDVVAIHLYNEMLGAIPNFGGGAAVAVSMLLPSIISILLINYLERYNFRYNRICRQDIVKSRLRDAMRILSSRGLLSIYGNSLWVALLTALLGTLLSYGAALASARSGLGRVARGAIDGIAVVTNTIPGMVLGLAFLFAFTGTSLQNTFLILVLCNVVHFFTTPYLMGKSSLEKMNKGWEATAALMGDSWLKTLCRVVVPNSLGTVLEMFSYYFINSMITISAVIFLVGARTAVLTTKIKELQHYAQFDSIFVMSLLILATNILVRVILGGIVARCTKKQ